MSLPFHPEARTEVRKAFDQYDRIDPLLAADLVDAVAEAEAAIETAPYRNAIAADAPRGFDVRDKVLRRFRYRMIYQVAATGVRVLALAHLHRRPGYWKRRLAS